MRGIGQRRGTRSPTKRVCRSGAWRTLKARTVTTCSMREPSSARRDRYLTNGGRVLGVTALGKDLKEARKNAYEAVDWVDFDNKYYRHDIGKAIDEA